MASGSDVLSRIRDREDGVNESKPYFAITNAPGPFRLLTTMIEMYEKHGNSHVVDLTVRAILDSGLELLGHDREFKIPFEFVLQGPTTSVGHGSDQPRNIRLLGRFLITNHVQSGYSPYVDPRKAAPVLDEWQWEAIFNPETRKGLVLRLKEPLPWEWTL
ncbi:MAG: hypothetical protein A3A80_01485 [Candidatus Terrybacteria bacterium RIFCSPLOWO2_01_FULL_44_24]|uniref:Uncharacterized protein n=1 Tax=Candidatus Terrybacteria bacterium RIFCSPHIGHO2_01_FULL_43_35 TaxID=1802361 RepID=A0A1G2PFK9_9BACT|nr:MAG: hypothetical protein A2828_03860 [Candidatus Terrybacteria bacterium RIFCSPHIGHO2_01_FULL_43_35]OHA51752.1 MAG: hypothetical protein A3A80_01485 [Candidatus Terrybacteria bacterium RIFCSPLOWO2_01_FULL_44_24]